MSDYHLSLVELTFISHPHWQQNTIFLNNGKVKKCLFNLYK